MEEQRGVREKTTAKKSMHNKSAANKSTIKK